MNQKRTILALLLSIAVGTVFSACGSAASESKSTQPVSSGNVPVTSTGVSLQVEKTTAGSTSKAASTSQAVSTARAGGTLVVYFSCTGNTQKAAQTIAGVTKGTLYEIKPAQPYTDADLNYNDKSSRSTKEQNDKSARPKISGSVENWEQYDTVFLGYPIWWGEEPRILDTFAESCDFSGKTVIPFCTSGGSGIGQSGKNLKTLAGGKGTWLEGKRLDSGISAKDVSAWLSQNGM
jgi:flavodoxin